MVIITWSNLFDDTLKAVTELLGGLCNTLIACQLIVEDTLQVALTKLTRAIPGSESFGDIAIHEYVVLTSTRTATHTLDDTHCAQSTL